MINGNLYWRLSMKQINILLLITFLMICQTLNANKSNNNEVLYSSAKMSNILKINSKSAEYIEDLPSGVKLKKI